MFSKIAICLFTFFMTPNLIAYPFLGIINVPVTDLRAKPVPNTAVLPTSDKRNPLQITQLLLNEHVIAHEAYVDEHGITWLRINALQQEYYYQPLAWHGFPGWILADHVKSVATYPSYNLVVKSYVADLLDEEQKPLYKLSLGTRFWGKKINDTLWHVQLPSGDCGYLFDHDVYVITESITEPIATIGHAIIATAKKFLGNWYSWGGRSAQCNEFGLSSVDCSALINLSFMAHGFQIPRMSHEQFLVSQKVQCCSDLQPGDLIFFSSITKQSLRMDHVMLYLGDNMLLESTIAGDKQTRVVSFEQRMGKACNNLQYGDMVYDQDDAYLVFFGTLLTEPILKKLRHDALKNEYLQDFLNKRNMYADINSCKYH